jgi:hypothetical protein
MKNILLVLCLVIMPLASFGQKEVKPGTVQYLDFKRSFKEITLGMPISSIEDYLSESLDSTMVGPGMIAYDVIDPEMLNISDLVQIESILVLAFESRVTMIYMKLAKPNGSKLHEVFTQAYGRGTKPNQFMDRFIWRGKAVVMMLDYNGLGEDSLLMVDKDLKSKADDYSVAQNKKALSDF